MVIYNKYKFENFTNEYNKNNKYYKPFDKIIRIAGGSAIGAVKSWANKNNISEDEQKKLTSKIWTTINISLRSYAKKNNL